MECIFVGYDENVKDYRVWNPASKRVEVACNVKFVEANEICGLISNKNASKMARNEIFMEKKSVFCNRKEMWENTKTYMQ